MSKTLQPNGMMKYEIGDVTLLLSPAEDRMLCILVAGSSVHIATIEATRQVGMVQALFAQPRLAGAGLYALYKTESPVATAARRFVDWLSSAAAQKRESV